MCLFIPGDIPNLSRPGRPNSWELGHPIGRFLVSDLWPGSTAQLIVGVPQSTVAAPGKLLLGRIEIMVDSLLPYFEGRSS